jgi:hypothetical protein
LLSLITAFEESDMEVLQGMLLGLFGWFVVRCILGGFFVVNQSLRAGQVAAVQSRLPFLSACGTSFSAGIRVDSAWNCEILGPELRTGSGFGPQEERGRLARKHVESDRMKDLRAGCPTPHSFCSNRTDSALEGRVWSAATGRRTTNAPAAPCVKTMRDWAGRPHSNAGRHYEMRKFTVIRMSR